MFKGNPRRTAILGWRGGGVKLALPASSGLGALPWEPLEELWGIETWQWRDAKARSWLESQLDYLQTSRPTAVNLFNDCKRLKHFIGAVEAQDGQVGLCCTFRGLRV